MATRTSLLPSLLTDTRPRHRAPGTMHPPTLVMGVHRVIRLPIHASPTRLPDALRAPARVHGRHARRDLNQCQNQVRIRPPLLDLPNPSNASVPAQDLFFALRGGGGGGATFALVLSATSLAASHSTLQVALVRSRRGARAAVGARRLGRVRQCGLGGVCEPGAGARGRGEEHKIGRASCRERV